MASDINKRSSVFCFLDGQLTVKTNGYGEQNGWGNFAWDEDQVDILPHDEKDGSYVSVDIPPSELIELRDFLLRLLPLTADAVDGDAQWNAAIEEAARIAEESSFGFPIEVWMNSTKKEMTSITANAIASAIRSLKRLK